MMGETQTREWSLTLREPRDILREAAGALDSRRRRSTGTVVTVYQAEAQGIDLDSGRYAVVCEEHGTVVQDDARRVAEHLARHPEEWCEDCQLRRRP